MTKNKRQHPNRISAWVPDDEVWIHDCLDDVAKTMTENGVRTTKSDLIRDAVMKLYGHLKRRYTG